jgi:hypothetical protein
MGFLGVAVIVTGIWVASTFVYTRTHSTRSKLISCLLLVVGIALTGFSAFFFYHLDYIVHHDLYGYGLIFSLEWAVPYWIYARLMLGLQGLAMMIATVSIATIAIGKTQLERQLLPRTPRLLKIGKTKLIFILLSSVGAAAIAMSVYYTSSILAFIGLGLLFWGILLLYLTPTKHVKLEILNAIGFSTFTNLEKILTETYLGTRGIYLPPKYLTDFDSGLVFVPSKTEQALPKPDEVDEQKLYSKNPNGLFLTPPGLALSKLFEKELRTSFMKTDVAYLQEKLPKLLIEDLEIMENIDISSRDNTIIIEMENHIFKDICDETRKHQRLQKSVGCPLCSAFACTLAKATGRPIVIEKEEQTQDGKTTKIRYSILEE